MDRKKRRTNSVVRAVIRSQYWGQHGEFWTQELRKGKVADAFFSNGHDETFDAREARRTHLDLLVHGSIREATMSRIRFGRA